MKKLYQLFICVICIFACSTLYSQNNNPPIEMGENQTYTEAFDSIYQHVNFNNVPSNILYNRVFSFAGLPYYNRQNSDTSSYWHFIQAYSELQRASLSTNSHLPIPVDSLKRISTPSTIPIAILNFDFGVIDTNAYHNRKLYQQDGLWYVDNSKSGSLFNSAQTFVIAPMREKLVGNNFTFELNSSLLFTNRSAEIANLFIDFDDGNGFIPTIVPNSSNLVSYQTSGKKMLSFRIIFNNGDTLNTFAKIKIIVPGDDGFQYNLPSCVTQDTIHWNWITSNIPFQGYDEITDFKGALDMYIFYGNSEKKLRKPILIVDGFDPEDGRPVDSLWSRLRYKDQYQVEQNLGCMLLALNYDIVMVNFPFYVALHGTHSNWIDGGGDYIERNGYTLIAVIDSVNSLLKLSGSKEKIVVVGPSMGGQVTRFALAYMEHNNMPHNCRLWVSFDSPHHGANIAMSAQECLKYLSMSLKGQRAKKKYDNLLCSKAAKQMLIRHIEDMDREYYYRYYNTINSLGYPNKLRKVAASNGCINGTKTGEDHDIAFQIEHTAGIDITLWMVSSHGCSQPSPNECQKVAHLYCTSPGFISNKRHTNGLNCGYDAAPGGTYNTFQILNDEIRAVEMLHINESNITLPLPSHCFMPTYSTLGYPQGNQNPCASLSIENLINQNKIPFASAWAPRGYNMEHVTFNDTLVDYLLNEIETYIQGPDTVKDCGFYKYAVHLPAGTTATANWFMSSNLSIIAMPSYDTVIVRWNGQGSSAWINAA
ncbi:MAG: hypothetical protein LBU51_01625, partial [Bacteroidales bacterium]|nr:hypothetical protein [Bacteroidales bacterium]